MDKQLVPKTANNKRKLAKESNLKADQVDECGNTSHTGHLKKQHTEEIRDIEKGEYHTNTISSSERARSKETCSEMAIQESSQEIEKKAETLRKRNAVYSKRKYYKKKIEVDRLDQTRLDLEAKNRNLNNENQRLEALVAGAEKTVRIVESQRNLNELNLLRAPRSLDVATIRNSGSDHRNQLNNLLNEVSESSFLARTLPFQPQTLRSIPTFAADAAMLPPHLESFSSRGGESTSLSNVERILYSQQLSNFIQADSLNLSTRSEVSPRLEYNPLLDATATNILFPPALNTFSSIQLQQILLNNSNRNSMIVEHLLGRTRQNELLQSPRGNIPGLGSTVQPQGRPNDSQNNALIEYLLRRRNQQP